MYPDLTKVVEAGLRAEQKPPSGLLHCSSHSWKPLRFTQLEQVFASEEKDFGDLMTLHTGTMYHTAMEGWLRDYLDEDWQLIGTEIDCTHLLPDGWTGTMDWLFQHRGSGRYVVGDAKTIKPEGIQYLTGVKPEHKTQVSCYHASHAEQLDLDEEIFVFYLPKGRDSRNQTVMPRTYTTKALSKAAVWARLTDISLGVKMYLDEYEKTGEIENQYLAPMPDPVLSSYWNYKAQVWDVKRGPFWYNAYSGLPEEFVPKQSTNKVGEWTLDGYYRPRKGWEYIEEDQVPKPSPEDFRRRQNA